MLVLPAIRTSAGCHVSGTNQATVAVGPVQCTSCLQVLIGLIRGAEKGVLKPYLKVGGYLVVLYHNIIIVAVCSIQIYFNISVSLSLKILHDSRGDGVWSLSTHSTHTSKLYICIVVVPIVGLV